MFRAALFFFLAIALLASCSDAIPIIDQSIGVRLFVQDKKTGRTTQNLSVFVAYRFSDGIKNIQNLYILNDNLQILWQIHGQALQSFEQSEKKWVGNASLALAPGEPTPSGKFRVLLCDWSGHQVEAEFSLPRLDFDPASKIPQAVRDQALLSLLTPQAAGHMTRELVIKDWTGTETARFLVQSDSVDLSQALPGLLPKDYSIWLVDSWPEEGLLLSSGPW